MNGDIKENVTRRSIWLRFCFMVIMCVAFGLAEMVVFAVVAFQFLSSLFTGRINDQLVRLGRNLARYLQQITAYLTFATEEVPFPFMNWPDEPHEEPEPEPEPEADEKEPEERPAEEQKKDDRPAEPSSPPVGVAAAAAGSVTTSAEISEDQPEEVADTPAEDDKDATEGDISAEPDGDADDEAKKDLPEAPAGEGEEETPPAAKPAQATETAVFADGDAYQKFMGERSRLGGVQFVGLLDPPPHLSWLDVGCGTGAFSAVILENCDPLALIGIDSTAEQIASAKAKLKAAHADFRVGDATKLPFEADSFDVAVSSYVLNFVPEKQKMIDEMARVVRPEGIVAISVFDHAGGRNSSQPFWDAIAKRDPAYREAEFEKRGWNITHPDALTNFFNDAGLEEVFVESIEIEETFTDFDDYWTTMTSLPTSGSTAFIIGLDQEARDAFKDEVREMMAAAPDGSIKAKSASWVVRGKVPA